MDLNFPALENGGLGVVTEERPTLEGTMESVPKELGCVVKEEEVGDVKGEGELDNVEEMEVNEEEGKGKKEGQFGDGEELDVNKEEGKGSLGEKEKGEGKGTGDMEEGKGAIDGALIRRASRRISCRLAVEKIGKLSEESYEWEDKRRMRRGSKRERNVVETEEIGDGTGLQVKNEESLKRTRRKPRNDGADREVGGGTVAGWVGSRGRGRGRGRGGGGGRGGGRYSLRTSRDRQNEVPKLKGRKKIEENVNVFGILV